MFHISHECRTPKRISPKPEFPKIQKSKNPNPSFGFLETRGICSNPKKKFQNSSSFQNSKNPKIPTPVSDFWKLEEFAQNQKKPKIPRVSKIPKIQKFHPKVWIFRNSRKPRNPKKPKIPRVSKNPKLGSGTRNFGWGLGFLDFWNFGNSRNFGFFGF